MKLNVAQDDADGFESACRLVLDRFDVWARPQLGVDEDLARDLASDARLALDWKWRPDQRRRPVVARPSAATEMVLSVIAEEHPSKAVAKAARMALFKRRSSRQR